MAQMTSGKVLRETRERKNYDLNTVARRLRIRPDILKAIEAGDFDAMPPRGYTRNMVNAYARLLSLNPTEIVNMYLDEAYAYQVERARDAAPGSGFVMESDYRRPRLRSRGARSDRATTSSYDISTRSSYDVTSRSAYDSAMPRQTPTYNEIPETTTGKSNSRHLYDDRTRYSRDDYGVMRERVERPGRSDRDFLSHHSGYSSIDYSAYAGRTGARRGMGREIRVGQTPMQYSASRMPSFFQSKIVLIIAAALVILAIVVVLFFVLGNKEKPAGDDVSQLPVSGISDTTGTNESEEAEKAQVEVAPTSSRVTYTVEKGNDCYIETYTDDGDPVGEMLSGPAQNTVEVTGTYTIATWSPDTIKVTVDGEEVKLTANSEYGGMYAYTVDFPQILADWKSTHTSRDSQRQAAVASANNAASQTSTENDNDTSSESAEDTGETDGSAQTT